MRLSLRVAGRRNGAHLTTPDMLTDGDRPLRCAMATLSAPC
ncbi:hypothetical protein XVE_2542 [Xanthomonas vesicatoria ATCC 35937]|uniref:Uncharacterized protein n=1 Tax=Xanthomonas vesicatoria ATCC 35937 TaxID=925775 RepID=F0BEB5_9XANT|nr:hypothetical protein XVE_2542 [Xanthomonas vesicatoria ATCC 35937]